MSTRGERKDTGYDRVHAMQRKIRKKYGKKKLPWQKERAAGQTRSRQVVKTRQERSEQRVNKGRVQAIQTHTKNIRRDKINTRVVVKEARQRNNV